jgi:hypothetical protein
MDLPDPAPQRLRAPLTDAIVRHRNILWGTLVVIALLAFNGTWRVGRDSALYRGLGHSLATGHGYSFGNFAKQQIYPGLPVLLAGLEKVFGQRDLPPILLIHAFSLGCLVFTYELVRLRYPQWVAVIVTFCVGINGWFLELTNEILADIPFLFGMLVALYGWERLRMAILDDAAAPVPRRRRIVRAIVCLILGLAIAALMRPTFWILAAAWVLVCLWGLIAGPHRRFYAACLAILAVAFVAVTLFRTKSFNPFAGGYEQEALLTVRHVWDNLLVNVPKMLSSAMAYGFFGQKWVPGLTELMNVIAIAAALLLLRREPLWTLLIFGCVAVTLVMIAIPRYYVMVLPLMALAWIVLVSEVAVRVPHRWLEVALLAGICLLVLPNFARCCKVIGEQRGWNRGGEDEGAKWQYVMEMSKVVHDLVPPEQKVIAPGASIMSYLSERQVVMQRDILDPKKPQKNWPQSRKDQQIGYAVFPSRLYKEGERSIRELMDRGVIVPTERVAKVGEMVLAKVTIAVPEPGKNWKDQPVRGTLTWNTTLGGTTRPSAQKIARKKRQVAAAKKALAAHKAQVAARHKKQLKLAKAQRMEAARRAAAKKRREARLRREAATRDAATRDAATQPATQPASQPSSQPAATSSRAGSKPGALPAHFDDGGFSGQSFASRRDSIRSRENWRGPRFIPWQRWAASSQFSFDARFPSQNGQVRHWSGRTS